MWLAIRTETDAIDQSIIQSVTNWLTQKTQSVRNSSNGIAIGCLPKSLKTMGKAAMSEFCLNPNSRDALNSNSNDFRFRSRRSVCKFPSNDSTNRTNNRSLSRSLVFSQHGRSHRARFAYIMRRLVVPSNKRPTNQSVEWSLSVQLSNSWLHVCASSNRKTTPNNKAKRRLRRRWCMCLCTVWGGVWQPEVTVVCWFADRQSIELVYCFRSIWLTGRMTFRASSHWHSERDIGATIAIVGNQEIQEEEFNTILC